LAVDRLTAVKTTDEKLRAIHWAQARGELAGIWPPRRG
jgi:hypothetical protein